MTNLPVKALSPHVLRQSCDPQQFDFNTTDDLESTPEVIGQERATEAIRLALRMPHKGYNIFALGSEGSGRHFLLQLELEKIAKTQEVPQDLCYVNNFIDSNKPNAMLLPTGTALSFKKDMQAFVEEVITALPLTFEGEDYQARLMKLQQEFKKEQGHQFEALEAQAKEKNIAMLSTPAGTVFTPMQDGKPIPSEAVFNKLDPKIQEQFQADTAILQEGLQKIVNQIPRWERSLRKQIRELNEEICNFTLSHLLEDLEKKYETLEEIKVFLTQVKQDIIENVSSFIKVAIEKSKSAISTNSESTALERRYAVNVLIDHSQTEQAPIIFEDHPTFENVVGSIEHIAQMGTLVTDFGLIKAGALHRANGGYLLIEAGKLLQQPYAWEGLKRCLKSECIRTESIAKALSLASTVSLEPEAVPLNTKVILVGDRRLYYLLNSLDPEFQELFKIAADFDDTLAFNQENQLAYAKLIASMLDAEKLLPMTSIAVAALIEHAARLSGDAQKLSTHMSDLRDVIREATIIAQEKGQAHTEQKDVLQAISDSRKRGTRIYENMLEATLRNLRKIDTQGEKVGQINGLSVIQLAGNTFGQASRITGRVRLGKGEIIDIEREVDLGGSLHSKGVMILSNYLGATYASNRPLALHGSLVFEQSYGGVDGDSASSAELYVLLSAISNLPIKQSLAVTGSVNQYGEVQVIGGVNEKIEGFFDLCNARGLTGEQSVLIPEGNVQHLMLRRDVIEAVAEGLFHIYPIGHINQGIALLTGVAAGEQDSDGNYPKNTVNALVNDALNDLSTTQLSLMRAAQSSGKNLEQAGSKQLPELSTETI